MHKRYLFTFIFSISSLALLSLPVAAVSHNVIISQVQVGNSSTSRLIELYNTSEDPVDVTDWCIYHSSASGKTKEKLLCFGTDDPQTHLILSGLSYILVGSDELGVDADFILKAGLGTVTGGHIYVIDENQSEIDRVGWGTAVEPETAAFNFDPTNLEHVIERQLSLDDTYVDLDDNSLDFINSSIRSTYLTGAISEVDDTCSNVDGIQPLMPDGYYRDDDGLCQPYPVDVCLNIDDLQAEVPLGYEINENGECIRTDICSNFDGIQASVPNGFVESEDNCIVDSLPLRINEILPNASGNDNGREFIELYNPNDISVDLEFYRLFIGSDQTKFYDFPTGSEVNAKDYVTFYNNQIPFTLANTSDAVGLGLIDGTKIDVPEVYLAPQDDVAWALIGDSWQYTNKPTPGEVNLKSVVTDVSLQQSVNARTVLRPCLVGQYRNPATNRCRNSLTEPTLVACGANEYRNPDTNRCRSVLGASTSSPTTCGDGKVRNPETNRCKAVVQMTAAPYPVQTSEVNSSEGYMGWWIAGCLGLIAIGYAIWEWRSEIARFISWFAARTGSRGQS